MKDQNILNTLDQECPYNSLELGSAILNTPNVTHLFSTGNDPSTDLRGCGMLGLLTLLHLVNSPATKSLAAKMYTLSRDEVQNFPFSVMSINITRMALQILRTGKINK